MRRYDIVSGILLILSIIDFALAAPVLEKRQAGVDVVHIPKDVITVLGRRGDEELEKLAEEFLKTLRKPIDSSDAHASAPSSSAPAGPEHGSTNVVQAPVPNQASSTANPGLLMEPSSPSSVQGEVGYLSDPWSLEYKANDGSDRSLFTPGSSEYQADSGHELSGAHSPRPNPDPNPNPNPRPSTNPDPEFDWNYWMSLEDPPPPRPASPKEIGLAPENQVGHVQQPNPAPSTGADPDFNWDYWMSSDGPLARPAPPKEVGPTPEYQESVQRPNPGPFPNPGYMNPILADENFWGNPVDSSGTHALSNSPPAEPDHGSTNVLESASAPNLPSSTANPGPLVKPSSPSSTAPIPGSWDHFNALWDDLWSYKPGAHVQQPNPGLSTELDTDRNLMSEHQPEHEVVSPPPSPNLGSPKEPDHDVVHEPPPTPELTDPELYLDHQSLSTDSQPVDLQTAIYYAAKAKGKEKLPRRISGTSRDVGNAVQRELKPGERSLDTGE